MKAREFIDNCVLCGYASKKVAEEYARDKKRLTEQDYMEVFRINEKKNDVSHGILSPTCNYDGDDLIELLNRTPRPWNKDIDLNRGIRDMREDGEDET